MNANKKLFIVTFLVLIAFGSMVVYTNRSTATGSGVVTGDTQIIEIKAKGGFSPRRVEAKAGVDTVLKISTDSTYDCSASVIIPKISYNKILPPTGIDEVKLGSLTKGETLKGGCSMGMYGFEIDFI